MLPKPGAVQKSNQTVKSSILGPAQWENGWPTYQGLLHKAAVPVFSLGHEKRPHLFQGRLKKIVTHSHKSSMFQDFKFKSPRDLAQGLYMCFSIEL